MTCCIRGYLGLRAPAFLLTRTCRRVGQQPKLSQQARRTYSHGQISFSSTSNGIMLTPIPTIEQLSSRVWRILGCNPGPYTLQGTNTYLIGTGSRRLLLDTGEKNKASYIKALQKVLEEQKVTISDVIVTHWHHDHLGGVPDVHEHVTKGAAMVVYKMRRLSDPDEDLGKQITYNFVEDGHKFTTEGATLRAMYTPGHTDDHMCLHLEEDNIIFSGDTVLGQGTAVFEDLYTYMKSLQFLLDQHPRVVFPAHGPVITDPDAHISGYLEHRTKREKQIHTCMCAHPGTALTPMEIVKEVYHDVPEHLHSGAAGNVRHHLSKLVKEAKVELIKEQKEDRYKAIDSCF